MIFNKKTKKKKKKIDFLINNRKAITFLFAKSNKFFKKKLRPKFKNISYKY